ncbi:MAG TPA: tripartite tricarboxylate transporter substrate-binding protein [Hyphomicrobiaceae bacterium]|jgi:tripartite-type tricarboxylate transporter receptor subunit TctC|nr:tripartite tricarboxylate transporter substrate-binding protein [Hyphomicrobiaceae bacterium]
MRALLFVIVACVALVVSRPVAAQTYPERPITFIVPYGAGGPLDTVARLVTERMRIPLRQNTVIENVTGASGTIGVGRAVRAAPDGYTVCVGNWPTHVVNGAMFNLPYDLVEDFEHVALLTSNPYIMLVRKNLPAKDVRELIAFLKANPGGLTLGTAGPGAGQHIGGLYFQNVTGTTLRFVPYRAGAIDILKDLVGGHIDMTFEQAISALPSVRGGIVNAYAVASDKRLAAAPDIPTVDEAGAPGVHISAWSGLFVPKGTPKETIATLTKAAMEALADPALIKRLEDLGQTIPAPEQQTAEALRAYHKAEIARWWPLIKAANIKSETPKAEAPK